MWSNLKYNILPDTLCLTAGLDHSKGLRSTPVPEVQLVVGGNKQQLGCGVEGQGRNSYVSFSEPALTATLQNKTEHHLDFY